MKVVEFSYRGFDKRKVPDDKEHIEFSVYRCANKILMRSVDKYSQVHDFSAVPVDNKLVLDFFKEIDNAVKSNEWADDTSDKGKDLPLTEIELTFEDGSRKSYYMNGFILPNKQKIVACIRQMFRISEEDDLFYNFN